MEYILENKELSIRIESFGAELVGIKDRINENEYIWQKNSKYWGKSSPVLFPFVGSIRNGKYQYEGKEYEIKTRHGFARDNEFKIFNRGKDFIEFVFEYSKNTLEIYPFKFKLFIKYTLKDRSLEINYRINNLGEKEMYFSFGAHPAFNINLDLDNNYEDYCIEFDKNEIGNSKVLQEGFVVPNKEKEIFKEKKLNLKKDIFINDALIFENVKSKLIYLKNKKNEEIIKFKFANFEYLAFWGVQGGNFICFEPWDGITDYINSSGKLKEKIGIRKLESNKEKKYDIMITV
ncbi:aldose 1-epimerase family protein [Fusobacterium sp. MFO224]|uniref:aldose 1-epimerase family protein n=1 Tax=Fusobacterium sp. MFO224 TaxID=3378070 RepID=UPI0038542F33